MGRAAANQVVMSTKANHDRSMSLFPIPRCSRWAAAVLLLAVVPVGEIRSVVGTGAAGYTGDGGPAVVARLNQPFGVIEDRGGNLLVADMANHCIRRVDHRSQRITTIVGCGRKGDSGDGGLAPKAMLNEPYGLALDDRDNLFIIDRLNARVRRVDAKTRVITTVAGTGTPGFSGDGG